MVLTLNGWWAWIGINLSIKAKKETHETVVLKSHAVYNPPGNPKVLLFLSVFVRLMCFRPRRSLKFWMQWVTQILSFLTDMSTVLNMSCMCVRYVYEESLWCITTVSVSLCPVQMLSFMRAQYTLFQQGFNILDEIDPYMKRLAAQVRRRYAAKRLTTETVDLFCRCSLSCGNL